MTNEIANYKYKEICLLDTEPDKVFVIVRSKYYTTPNTGGKISSGWSFVLQGEDQQVYREGGEMWFPSSRLKKLHVPSDYSFAGLMVVLKDIVNKEDFQ